MNKLDFFYIVLKIVALFISLSFIECYKLSDISQYQLLPTNVMLNKATTKNDQMKCVFSFLM